MRPFYILLSLILGVGAHTSCTSQYNIDGNASIQGFDGQKMYLRLNTCDGPMQTVCIDSCEVVHGVFNFGGAVDSVVMAELYLGSYPMMPVVLEDGRLLVQMDNIEQSITGGPLNERLSSFLAQRFRCENSLVDLDRRARLMLYQGKSTDEVMLAFDPLKESVINRIRELDAQFVRDNYTNPLGPGYFMRICTDDAGFPRNDCEIVSILADAPQAFLRNPFIDHFIHHAGITNEMLLECRENKAKAAKKKSKKSSRDRKQK